MLSYLTLLTFKSHIFHDTNPHISLTYQPASLLKISCSCCTIRENIHYPKFISKISSTSFISNGFIFSLSANSSYSNNSSYVRSSSIEMSYPKYEKYYCKYNCLPVLPFHFNAFKTDKLPRLSVYL